VSPLSSQNLAHRARERTTENRSKKISCVMHFSD
jgi:hypothetical protein